MKRPETTVPGRNAVSQARSPVGYRPPFFAGLAAGFGFAAPAGLTGAGAGFGFVAIFACLPSRGRTLRPPQARYGVVTLRVKGQFLGRQSQSSPTSRSTR